MTARLVDLGDRRFERDVAAAYRHGPAFIVRLLGDWAARNLQRTELESLFRDAAALDADAIAATGAYRWPS